MNASKVSKLKETYGCSVIWEDADGYNFTMDDYLTLNESNKMVELCETDINIKTVVALGDDIINLIIVKDISALNTQVEEFIDKHIGSNCYSQ